MLETKHLEAILVLAQTGSFHKAAAALYISQPALSTALKKLEDQLGVTLFERNSSGVKPTPLCQSLLPLAKKIMEELINSPCAAQNTTCSRSWPPAIFP